MKTRTKIIIRVAALVLGVFSIISCGSKKHTKCDAYGNKSGQNNTKIENIV
jgi:hypothetical protein